MHVYSSHCSACDTSLPVGTLTLKEDQLDPPVVRAYLIEAVNCISYFRQLY